VITDTADRDTARASARNAVASSLSRPWYAATIARLGYSDQQISAVSDDLVDAIVAHGDPGSIAASVTAHHEAGADHVVLMPSAMTDLDLLAGAGQLERLAPAVLRSR
jgi:alkanesulfonate monooxygenase SsuD/methylene tetrahydromethanopterin reductase-like flavin-dependent oxidoreductase (luciferase family)